MNEEIARLQRRLEREKLARKEAEQLLEEKSLELFYAVKSLRGLTQNLEKKVAARTEALTAAVNSAERANRSKSEFLSRMSHELRTPLNAILGFGQLLQKDRKHPLSERQQEYLGHMLKSGQHLLKLINEVLDLSKIESENLTLKIELVAVADVIMGAIDLMSTQAEARQITIHPPELEDQLQTLADPLRLKQVILNLLSNAVKYNREQGDIFIRTHTHSTHRLRIEVEDSGQGIPQEKTSELFQPFSRLGAEYTEVEGTGIGLVISRKIVEAMGGEIGVSSQPGEGSIFWIDMPLARDPAQQRQQISAVETMALADNDGISSARHLILLVEDNPVNLRLMERIFDYDEDIELIAATSAEQGIELAREHIPALILMDISLPGMNGIEALKHLRADPLTKDVPVVAVSANAMSHDVREGNKAGFDAYVTKPLVIREFLSTVDTLLKR